MITALLGALVNRATTIPALGVPVAAHSSTIVCWRPPHCAHTPCPSCHFRHRSLGAAAEGAAGRTVAPDEVDDVLVTVHEAGVALVLEPAAEKRVPRSDYEGKFSLQYSIASMLVRGHVSVSDFTEDAISDPAVLAVAAKVVYETPEYPTYPQAFPGGVRVRLASGDTLTADFPYQKGGPENPLSASEVSAKFRGNASLALPADRAARVTHEVGALATAPNLEKLMQSLAL